MKSDTVSDGVSESKGFLRHGMGKLEESEGNEKTYTLVRRNFPLSMGSLGNEINVVAIHKKMLSCDIWKAKLKAFHNFSNAVAERLGGNANLRNAWYGGSRSEISEVVDHGFGRGGDCGGLCLSHIHYPLHSVLTSMEDMEGLRHILMCRVILGRTGKISQGLEQLQQTGSIDFDSGVDNLYSPTKYMVWNSDMIIHTMPCFIITFTAPSHLGWNRIPAKRPNSA